MSQISRLRDAEISNGNLINADDIDAELNQLVSESNSQDTRIGAIESSAITLNGIKSFASAPKMDQIDERTSNVGVTIDGVLVKDGGIRLNPVTGYTPSANGELGYDSTSHAYKVVINGAAKILRHDGNTFPKGYLNGPVPVYTSASTITLKAGTVARNSSNMADIEVGSDLALSLSAAGANGLDAGIEAANTWYYVYLIKKSGDGTVAGLLSTVNEASIGGITLPAGYDLKRQLPLAVRNDSSSNIIPFVVSAAWPHRPRIRYRDFTNATATYRVLNAGSATTETSISFASLVPPISTIVGLNAQLVYVSNSQECQIRKDSSVLTRYIGFAASGNGTGTHYFSDEDLTSSQTLEYKMGGGGSTASFFVREFIVTEVNS